MARLPAFEPAARGSGAPATARARVHVVLFDRGLRNLGDEFEVTEIAGLRRAYVQKRTRYGRTVLRKLMGLPGAARSLRTLVMGCERYRGPDSGLSPSALTDGNFVSLYVRLKIQNISAITGNTVQLASGPSGPPVSHCGPCQRVSSRRPMANCPAFCPDQTKRLAKSNAAWKSIAKASEPVRRSVRQRKKLSKAVEAKSSQRSCGFRK